MGTARDVTGDELRHLIDAGESVLVDVWATWCGPCKTMAPRLDEVSATLGDVVRVVKLNAESEQDLARQLGVKALPTLIFFKGGHEVRRSTGSKTAREVIDMVTKSGD